MSGEEDLPSIIINLQTFQFSLSLKSVLREVSFLPGRAPENWGDQVLYLDQKGDQRIFYNQKGDHLYF